MPPSTQPKQYNRPRRRRISPILLLWFLPYAHAVHHMQRGPLAWVNKRADNRPLVITNQCKETIYPGIGTQAGTGPSTQGFHGQTFYDISLVDGYNTALGIIAIGSDVPPNLTNPMCIGTASLLAAAKSGVGQDFGTNSSYPIPLEESESWNDVQGWCPWDLQLDPPKKPGDGVYPYPDDNIKRPYFNPCYSACAKYNKASDCCIGKYNSPTVCQPSLYSTQAKKVCPDAYSFAFDDQTSTFIIPSGPGFEVVFCPPGRSSTILKSMSSQRMELARHGLSQKLLQDSSNATLVAAQSLGSVFIPFDMVLAFLLPLSMMLANLLYGL
ncbi:MAG: hypothetical protein Q9170_003774 [Blastenia crenularia]